MESFFGYILVIISGGIKVDPSEWQSFVQASDWWVLKEWVWINAWKTTSSTLESDDEISRWKAAK